MSKEIAVINNSGVVTEINIHLDDYELKNNEVLVTNPAYVGGDYFNGYFYPEQPFPSWTRDKGNWKAPVPMPEDAGTGDPPKRYQWDEVTVSWKELEEV
jgi:hypothetical protein